MTENKKDQGANALAIMKRDVIDTVTERVRELTGSGELHMPGNYSAENAMKEAWLALQEVEDKNGNKALAVCTPNSVANALLAMVIQGLHPGQGYFIVYGKQLVFQRGRFGNAAIMRRIAGEQSEVTSQCIYEGDEFEYTIDGGRAFVTKHTQRLENIKLNKILGAYATAYPADGRAPHTEIMTLDQIKKAWAQGATKGESSAHKNFTDEMCRKTAEQRATKMIIRSATDSHLLRALRQQEVFNTEAQMEATVEDETAAEILDFEGPEEPSEEPEAKTEARGEPETPESPQEAAADGKEGETELTPGQQLQALVKEHGLNVSEARREAARLSGVSDVRKLGNEQIQEAFDASGGPDGFVENVKSAEGNQAKVGGPSF